VLQVLQTHNKQLRVEHRLLSQHLLLLNKNNQWVNNLHNRQRNLLNKAANLWVLAPPTKSTNSFSASLKKPTTRA
jgi:hypothetical protein